MLLRPSTVIVALFATCALAATCNPGEYRDGSNACQTCPDGSISTITSPDGDPAYWCTPCPAGQSSDSTYTSCDKCSPGTYNSTPGGICQACATGTFNNVSGAKSCCTCCAGFFSDASRTFCNQCPSSDPYSAPGSSSPSDCQSAANQGSLPSPVASCHMQADNVCPDPTQAGPVGTAITRKRRMPQCMQKGFKACPRYSGRGGFDCVDTENDPESCGGCLTVDGKGDGKDCTAVKGVSVTRCVEGGCVIDSCRRGWKKSLDGKTCTSVSGGPGTSSSSSHHSGSNLHVQGVNAQKPKKFRTTAKRAIHPKIY